MLKLVDFIFFVKEFFYDELFLNRVGKFDRWLGTFVSQNRSLILINPQIELFFLLERQKTEYFFKYSLFRLYIYIYTVQYRMYNLCTCWSYSMGQISNPHKLWNINCKTQIFLSSDKCKWICYAKFIVRKLNTYNFRPVLVHDVSWDQETAIIW
jgi:hypothetical protein